VEIAGGTDQAVPGPEESGGWGGAVFIGVLRDFVEIAGGTDQAVPGPQAPRPDRPRPRPRPQVPGGPRYEWRDVNQQHAEDFRECPPRRFIPV
jgi:hypothetical protein